MRSRQAYLMAGRPAALCSPLLLPDVRLSPPSPLLPSLSPATVLQKTANMVQASGVIPAGQRVKSLTAAPI
jgi:hypothetical protein